MVHSCSILWLRVITVYAHRSSRRTMSLSLSPKKENPKNTLFYFPQDTTLEQMVQQMEVAVGFVSKPSVIRDGQAAMCILRPLSAKELLKQQKDQDAASQSDNSTSSTAESETPGPPVGSAETTEGSLQQ